MTSYQPSNNSERRQQTSPPYVVYSETNQRENNEDSFLIFSLTPRQRRKPIEILAVADGMGGHAYGEEASREALRKISLSLFEQLTVEVSINCSPARATPITPSDLAQALIAALEQTNAHIKRLVERNRWSSAGSTAVIAAILDDIAVVANLGDSPLFHYQARTREFRQITEDHTVAGALLRAGMIDPKMAQHHEGRTRLQFFVGCPELPPEPPVHQVKLEPGDRLLLCSDGISGSLPLEKMAEIVAASTLSLSEIAETLADEAIGAGETDNQTLILWSCQSLRPSYKNQTSIARQIASSTDTPIKSKTSPQERLSFLPRIVRGKTVLLATVAIGGIIIVAVGVTIIKGFLGKSPILDKSSTQGFSQPIVSETEMSDVEMTQVGQDKNEQIPFLIQPQYDEVQSFSEGLAAVKQGDKWGYIDRQGNTVRDFEYEEPLSSEKVKAIVEADNRRTDSRLSSPLQQPYNNSSSDEQNSNELVRKQKSDKEDKLFQYFLSL